MVEKMRFVMGVDYGTDSVRALLVDTETGNELAISVYEYPRWKKGLYCNPEINQFRQHPLDYIEGLQITIQDIIRKVPGCAKEIKAISIDTTGSTPVAVNQQGIPLALTAEFAEEPDAMFILWKDHTATEEADQINALCQIWSTDYSAYSGGIYSSEWFWSKVMHVVKTNTKVAKATFSWVEHCDWMPALLTGQMNPLYIKRSRCAAGHKAMWHEEWGGLPSKGFLSALHPELGNLKDQLFSETFTSDASAGTLSQEWAEKLGLNTLVLIGVGALDAHFGAVGGQIEPFYLSKVIGTSTCDMIVVPNEEIGNKLIRGISGQVDGSIIPGMLGMEAGQSAFGDVYAWFRDLLMWPLKNMRSEENEKTINELESHLIGSLSTEAS
jgi:L-ribulokinase